MWNAGGAPKDQEKADDDDDDDVEGSNGDDVFYNDQETSAHPGEGEEPIGEGEEPSGEGEEPNSEEEEEEEWSSSEDEDLQQLVKTLQHFVEEASKFVEFDNRTLLDCYSFTAESPVPTVFSPIPRISDSPSPPPPLDEGWEDSGMVSDCMRVIIESFTPVCTYRGGWRK